jgi:GT2 family glycosyltransferase|tara:strand:- start:307 stop:1374 length:1068 start_codon:yes stop_codon:yes gene_type:complete
VNDTTIIIPAIKNSPILSITLDECLKLKTNPNIIIVTDDIENQVYNKYKNVEYMIVPPGMTMSKKRNIAVKKCQTKYVAFFDSDSFPATQDWIINAIICLEKDPSIYAVGGPDTSPPLETKDQKDIGLLKKSFLISGFRNHRKNILSEMYVTELCSCNLFMERKKYLEMNGMDEELYTGEDTDLYNRIIAKGYKLYYSPKIHAYHFDRYFKGFLIERYDRGMQSTVAIKSYFKRIFLKEEIKLGSAYTHKTFRFDFLINPMFIIYLIGLLLFPIFTSIKIIYFFPLILYFFVLTIESLRLSNVSINFFKFFFQLFTCTIIQSIASVLLFFNLSINLKKYYRNVSDNYLNVDKNLM